jgi:arabinosaccharide transport system substrate-binding protein
MDAKRTSRRDFLRISALTAAGASLAACAAPAQPAPQQQAEAPKATEAPKPAEPTAAPAAPSETSLVIWTFGSFFTDFYNKIFPKYKELAPNVTIKVEEMQGGQEFDNLLAAFAAGTGAPDIPDIEQGSMSRFFKGDIGLIDLTDMIKPHQDDYVMARLDPYAYQGKAYGIDHCLCPVVLFYRWDLFEQAGVPVPVATWDDFKTQGEKLKAAGTAAISLEDRGWGSFHMLCMQKGTGGFFTPDGQPNFNSPTHVEVLQWYADLLKSGVGITSPTGDTIYAALGEGKIASQIGADWYGGFLKNNIKDVGKGKWKAVPMPAWKAGEPRTAANGGTGYTITKQSKAPEEAWKFIEWAMFDKDNKYLEYQVNGLLPPIKSHLSDPRYLTPDEWFSGQALGELYLEMAKEQPRHYRSPYFTEAVTLIGDAVYAVVGEGKAPQEALDAAMTELKRQMEVG